jgi:transposase
MLADQAGHSIGVDPHKDRQTTAVVGLAGAVIATAGSPPPPSATWTATGSPSSRRPAVGCGRPGAPAATGRAHRLPAPAGQAVVESDRPARPARRNGATTDHLDAVGAAREALGRDHLASRAGVAAGRPAACC